MPKGIPVDDETDAKTVTFRIKGLNPVAQGRHSRAGLKATCDHEFKLVFMTSRLFLVTMSIRNHHVA
ncbi:MAG: hypothetical protein EBT99_12025 [Betaproteobacteria bacterium]|nr:hypothetical protein [Betaproteobacteria bacterium]